ncbi:hypothetical protein KBY24_13530 [Ruegeria pomeroyi]|uniref:Uncharacterized protein n=1 Tax=Ruegeria alba TaxID=2916756 RepID=A0ABS9NWF2_9RHOB|nr:hypothetical protein [Ruegeria alba]MCE8512871.1 hypothetical protein [Ruegeria pomeroyi]MCE8526397.1 hypothetical protein [Ruegeria pomeroyi]MCE8529665.1 hypothetical protein [Ruegeria pomeroyi]MCE8534407.1 hypothetical protein [Ruegeria pomeroyi]MCG6558514.1 hypothetical protein [Ruegeria alba]
MFLKTLSSDVFVPLAFIHDIRQARIAIPVGSMTIVMFETLNAFVDPISVSAKSDLRSGLAEAGAGSISHLSPQSVNNAGIAL